jgi:large subunit ribosomal protein L16
MLMPKKVKYRKQQRGRMTGKGLARKHAGFRSVWPEGARTGLDHRPPDRSQPRGHDAFCEARRQDLDPSVSGQAGHQEARRNPYGQRQGRSRSLGAVVRPEKILFEMEGVTITDAKEAMRLASHKLPLRTTFVKREVL